MVMAVVIMVWISAVPLGDCIVMVSPTACKSNHLSKLGKLGSELLVRNNCTMIPKPQDISLLYCSFAFKIS